MIPGFEKIIEQRIEKARQEGAFDNLPGKGAPLRLQDDRHVPEDIRLTYKILKNANFLPPEIELRKTIRQTEDLLAGKNDLATQYRLTKKLNLLITKANLSRSTRVEFEMPQRYYEKITARLDENKQKR
jgi:hypothetical protein